MAAALRQGMQRFVFLILLGASLGLFASAWLTLALIPDTREQPFEASSMLPSAGLPRVAPLCRNIFDASGSLCEEPRTHHDATASAAPCDAAPRLVATWVVATDPQRSVAVFAGMATPRSAGAKLGDQTLSSAGAMVAWLVDDAGGTCACRLFDRDLDVVPLLHDDADSSPPARDDGLTVVGDEVQLSDALLERMLAHPETLLGRAHLVPFADGARVYGVRRQDLLYRAGLRNGDVLESVDGVRATSFDALVQAVTAALARGQARIRLRRGSQIVERTLHARPMRSTSDQHAGHTRGHAGGEGAADHRA